MAFFHHNLCHYNNRFIKSTSYHYIDVIHITTELLGEIDNLLYTSLTLCIVMVVILSNYQPKIYDDTAQAGFEPATLTLTVSYSTAELLSNLVNRYYMFHRYVIIPMYIPQTHPVTRR